VFLPADLPALEGTAIYLHGYYTGVDQAWREHGLRGQFERSCLPWLFIAPEAPSGPREAVHFASLPALLEAVRTELGALPPGPTTVIGHSGAYRTIKSWLPEPRIQAVVLLDAAYGSLEPYAAWMRGLALARTLGGDPSCSRTLPAAQSRLSPDERRVLCYRSQYTHMELVEGGAAIPVVLQLAESLLLGLRA
jgi:hypothetical protein